MASSNSSWTCWLLRAETVRVFVVLFWLEWAMFNISVNQSQFALFVVKFKNLKEDEEKPDTYYFLKNSC